MPNEKKGSKEKCSCYRSDLSDIWAEISQEICWGMSMPPKE